VSARETTRRPWIPLRIASVVSVLYAAGHSSGFPWMAPDGAENAALIEHLKGYRFDMMGSSRTVWDFHIGFGLIVSLDLLVQAVLLWFLADLAKGTGPAGAARLRPLLATIAVAFLGNAILVGRYFFVVPLLMAVITVVCLGWALLAASRVEEGVSAQP